MKYRHDSKRVLSVVTGAILVGSLAVTNSVMAEPNLGGRNPATQGIGSSKEVLEEGAPLRHEAPISLVRASEFMGVDVFDNKNNKFAEVKDLAIDVSSSRISYVVVGLNGKIGTDKLVVMPPEAFRVFRNNDEVKLDITEQMVKQLPSVSKDSWITSVDQQALAASYKVFSLNTPSTVPAGTRVSKASDLVGADVAMTRQESKDAKIKDMALDLQEGYAPYAIVSVGGIAGINEKLTAVPTNALIASGGKDKLQIAISEAQLKAAPEIDQKQWERALSDRDIGATVYSSYGTTPYWDMKNGTQGAVGGSKGMNTQHVEGRSK